MEREISELKHCHGGGIICWTIVCHDNEMQKVTMGWSCG